MRIGIRTKFLLIVSTLLFAIFSGITLFQIQSMTQSLRKDLFDKSRAFATLATQPIGLTFSIYKDSGTLRIDQRVNNFTSLDASIVNIAVVDINGDIAYNQDSSHEVVISRDEAASFEPIYRNNDAGALQTVVYPYFEASGAHRYSVIYAISDQEVESAVRREAMSILAFGILSLLLTTASLYFLINLFIIRPLQEVSAQAAAISAGNLDQQIAIRAKDELGELGQAVNKMAESLKKSIAELKEVDKVKSEFMMITSHNLRTPLTIINGYLDSIELFAHDADKLRNALDRIASSVRRLDVFAEDVLTISRFELGDSEFDNQTVKISDFMEKLIDEFTPTARLKELEFETDIHRGEDELAISRPYIRSAVWNILDNAAKFTPKGGRIKLSTKRVGENIHISVSDSGIGINKSEMPKLFTKFHRGTSTLTYDFEGTGIGLYASKVIVEKYGGNITAESEEGKGSTFTIKLPVSMKHRLTKSVDAVELAKSNEKGVV